MNLIFFGRLEKEKGILYIYNLAKNSNYNFYIFGSGTYEYIFNGLENVKFYGWKNFDFIKQVLIKMHFTLMPSIFLETFGLSALQSCCYGIPVIGFKKGALKDFILDDFDIYEGNPRDLTFEEFNNWFFKKDRSFYIKNWYIYSKKVMDISKNYTMESWILNFKKICQELYN